MAQFKAFAPEVEVRGDVVLSVVAVMGAFKTIALGILSDNGIKDPQPDGWYLQQAWLNSFQTIANEIGPNTLYQIGRQIPDQATYPDHINSVPSALSGLDEAYRSVHRGGEVGHYNYHSTGERSGTMVCHSPNPCEFDRGLLQSLTEHFEPPDGLVDVQHDSGAPCKKLGGDSCTYHISW